MPRTTSITIGEHLDRFINEMIESGRYGSTSEVVRSGVPSAGGTRIAK